MLAGTVKNPSEQSLLNAVEQGQRLGKAVVVAGCVPEAEKAHKSLAKLSVVGVMLSIRCCMDVQLC